MIISNSRKFIFIHIPKTAGDSASTALGHYVTKEDFILRNGFQGWKRRVTGQSGEEYPGLQKHSPAVIVRTQVPIVAWESYFKFAFVRHPVQRAVSFYTYMAHKTEERRRILPRNLWYQIPPGRRDDPGRWPGMKIFAATNSFSEFIRHPDIASEPALDPQCDFVCDSDGELLVDYIGRFEQLDADMAVVYDRIGIPNNSITHRNKSRIGLPSKPILTDDDLDFLAKKYEPDFTRFGYDI